MKHREELKILPPSPETIANNVCFSLNTSPLKETDQEVNPQFLFKKGGKTVALSFLHSDSISISPKVQLPLHETPAKKVKKLANT